MKTLTTVWVVAAMAMAVLGCSSSHGDSSQPAAGVGCLATMLDGVPGIVVEVRDMMTNDPIASAAIGSLQDGSYQEVMQPYKPPQASPLLSLQGAIERAGTYNVLVQVPGYKDWTRSNVTVVRGNCDVVTVFIMADMEKAS